MASTTASRWLLPRYSQPSKRHAAAYEARPAASATALLRSWANGRRRIGWFLRVPTLQRVGSAGRCNCQRAWWWRRNRGSTLRREGSAAPGKQASPWQEYTWRLLKLTAERVECMDHRLTLNVETYDALRPAARLDERPSQALGTRGVRGLRRWVRNNARTASIGVSARATCWSRSARIADGVGFIPLSTAGGWVALRACGRQSRTSVRKRS